MSTRRVTGMTAAAIYTRRRRSVKIALASASSVVVPRTAGGWPRMAPHAVICSLLAFIVYSNTLQADFAYDDNRAIKTNPDVLPETPLSSLLRDDFWGTRLGHSGSHKSYRPLAVLSFRANFALGGFSPAGYHLVNVLLHCCACALFSQLAGQLLGGGNAPAARFASLLFAVHPVHTEAVAGVVGRADVGAAIFFLLSFFSYSAYLRQRDLLCYESPVPCGDRSGKVGRRATARWRHLLLCFSCAAFAMLTKEHGVSVLGVCFVYDVLVYNKLSTKEIPLIFTEKYRRVAEGPVFLVVTLAVLLCARLLPLGVSAPQFSPADNPAAACDSQLTRLLTLLYLPLVNAGLLLCPSTLSFDWSMEAVPLVVSGRDPRCLATLAFYSVLAMLAVRLGWCLRRPERLPASIRIDRLHQRRQRVAGSNGTTTSSSSDADSETSSAGSGSTISTSVNLQDALLVSSALLVIPFLPASNLFFYVGFVVAERVLYIPSLGYCLLVGCGYEALRRRLQVRARQLLHALALLLLVVMATRTFRRNLDWNTEERLYRSGIPVNPPKAYGNLANILSSKGLKDAAERAYRKALSYRSNMADVHYNLGILYQEQKRFDEALQSYERAIHFRPRMATAHLNKGLVLGMMGRKTLAADVYRHCSTLDGSGLKDPRTHETTKISALFNLGRLHADAGSHMDAVHVYLQAVDNMPQYYQPQSLYNMLGEAFFKLGNFSEAELWYKKALKAKPDHVPAHLTYAKLLAAVGRSKEAESWFVKAKELSPQEAVVYQHYGQYLADSDRLPEAADIYRRAAELAPDQFEMVFNAANVLRQSSRNEEAEHYYRIAVQLRPQDATSHMNLGAMLHVNGKLDDAEKSYMQALSLQPEHQITKANLQKLKQLSRTGSER